MNAATSDPELSSRDFDDMADSPVAFKRIIAATGRQIEAHPPESGCDEMQAFFAAMRAVKFALSTEER
ncbi:MAG: hypothetical protein WA208_20175 [Thermoanaerobaculia bacterium]